jgi:formate hydrogenlyase transcriptional activator
MYGFPQVIESSEASDLTMGRRMTKFGQRFIVIPRIGDMMEMTAYLGSRCFRDLRAHAPSLLDNSGLLDRRGEGDAMNSAASMHEPSGWLVEDGLRELEQLFRAVLSHQSEPILIVDDSRRCLYASSGAGKLFGLSMGKMIGRRLDDLGAPRQAALTTTVKATSCRDVMSGSAREFRQPQDPKRGRRARITRFLSLDASGQVVAWYSGAERIYGIPSGRDRRSTCKLPLLGRRRPAGQPARRIEKTAIEGHLGTEGWHRKQDGSRFWANA